MLFLIRKLNGFYKYKRKTICLKQCFTFAKTSRLIESEIKVKKKLRVLFFGTDSFSLPSLTTLHKNVKFENDDLLGTVTSFKSPANCVRLYAEQNNLKLFKWPIRAEECESYDIGVVVSFGHLIPEAIIKAFPLGMINVHASLLPRWRGAAPIIYAIMNGDKSTGVSIMKVEPKRFDVGDILAQQKVVIQENTFMPELHKQLSKLGAQLLLEVINNYPESFKTPTKQNPNLVTYAPKISPDIVHIDWSKLTANNIYKRFQALYGYKHLTTLLNSKSVQLIELGLPSTNLCSSFESFAPGHFVFHRERKSLLVCCADYKYIEIFKLRIEGKKVMSAMDFNNGFVKKHKKKELFFDNRSLIS